MNEARWVTPVITISDEGNVVWPIDDLDWHSQKSVDAN